MRRGRNDWQVLHQALVENSDHNIPELWRSRIALNCLWRGPSSWHPKLDEKSRLEDLCPSSLRRHSRHRHSKAKGPWRDKTS